MKNRVPLLPLALAIGLSIVGGSAMAQDTGRVLSSTPVMQQVGIPRQVCSVQQVEVQPRRSGAGAAIGALAGAALGSSVGGRGAERAAATVIGAIGGSVLGDRIEGSGEPEVRDVQRCAVQTAYENRVVAYNVVYEFAGKQYSVQMPSDPGPTIRLQVTPVGTTPPQTPVAALPAVQYVDPQAPTVVYVTPPPRYYVDPLYPAIGVGLAVGLAAAPYGYYGYYGRGYRRWR